MQRGVGRRVRVLAVAGLTVGLALGAFGCASSGFSVRPSEVSWNQPGWQLDLQAPEPSADRLGAGHGVGWRADPPDENLAAWEHYTEQLQLSPDRILVAVTLPLEGTLAEAPQTPGGLGAVTLAGMTESRRPLGAVAREREGQTTIETQRYLATFVHGWGAAVGGRRVVAGEIVCRHDDGVPWALCVYGGPLVQQEDLGSSFDEWYERDAVKETSALVRELVETASFRPAA